VTLNEAKCLPSPGLEEEAKGICPVNEVDHIGQEFRQEQSPPK